MDWQISRSQKELLDSLFEKVEGKVKKVLDLGSGRTSIFYLTDKYKDLIIKGVVYPGDNRKTDPIKECVKNTNYEIVESDIKDLDFNESFDLVLGHLFLGEAEKFADNQFAEILDKVFEIKTKYLVLINIFKDDVINYNLFLKKIAQTGEIKKLSYIKSEGGDDCIGFLIKKF